MGLNNYKFKDKVFNISTLSPNLLFYYKIKKPESINMSNFAAKISFYDISGNLLYYNKKRYAHWLFSKKLNKYEFVFWSKSGNELAFYEYERDSYRLVFVDLLNKVCYKFDLKIHEDYFYKNLDHNFDFIEIEDFALKNKIHNENLVVNKLKCSLFEKWYP